MTTSVSSSPPKGGFGVTCRTTIGEEKKNKNKEEFVYEKIKSLS